MQKKEQMRQAKMQIKQQEEIQKLGPKNPNWRKTFLMLWQEVKRAQLVEHSIQSKIVLAQIGIKNARDSTEEEIKMGNVGTAEDKKDALYDAIKGSTLELSQAEVQLSMTREQLLIMLRSPGKMWSVKEVFRELAAFNKLQEELFSLSEKGK